MKKAGWALFIIYSFIIVWYTLLTRSLGVSRANLQLMWSYREMLAGYKYWKRDVIQNIQNILFFIPYGFLFPWKRWIGVLAGGALLSTTIEVIQYIGGLGLAELDDVLCNTLGSMVGFWLFLIVMKIINHRNKPKKMEFEL